jgi:hypothetical protein
VRATPSASASAAPPAGPVTGDGHTTATIAAIRTASADPAIQARLERERAGFIGVHSSSDGFSRRLKEQEDTKGTRRGQTFVVIVIFVASLRDLQACESGKTTGDRAMDSRLTFSSLQDRVPQPPHRSPPGME